MRITQSNLIAKILAKTSEQAVGAHKANHAVGGTDSVFPPDPGADKFLKFNNTSNAIEWNDAGSSFAGTMDDIDDGETYVKTENNYTDEDKTKLDGLSGGLTQPQIMARSLGC